MNLDTDVILQTYDLADMINRSKEVMEYLQYKQALEKDPEVIALKKKLQKEKESFAEVQRFGRFHPSYHEVKQRIDQVLTELDQLETVKQFKKAEENLDQLFYLISRTIAHSISKSIKVPRNGDALLGGSCSTGSCSSCGLSGVCAI
ncbi:YlbF family regulator [Tepidibacillus sp. HK-1]|uniref:YlbF family regulator n=1 Tax=Tepidibacillus sp. HK-1 TaxID=1883407 RepID=UPI00085344A3|nr:YlbF family regulator [Tepidibacillus sp. HK-1]GBF12555.1 hypothetical protein HK1_02621 [Tepidibacillus sp. HK-1]